VSLAIDNSEELTASVLAALRQEAQKGNTLQESAQRLMEAFRAYFADSVVLARTYATIPQRLLPEKDRAFLQSMAHAMGVLPLLGEDCMVLSLLGTSGVEAAWCDRYASREHLAVPLISQQSVAAIPMVAGLIEQLGRSADWYARTTAPSGKGPFAVFADSFFVHDAATSRDRSSRLIVPAQEFVRQWNLHSVMGVGGQFGAGGPILACVFFSRESLLETPKWLMRVPLLLGTFTQAHVAAGRLYAGG